jgi:hypothetical protein
MSGNLMKQEFVYGGSTIVLSSQKGNDPWLAIEATQTSMEAKIKAAKRGRRSKH